MFWKYLLFRYYDGQKCEFDGIILNIYLLKQLKQHFLISFGVIITFLGINYQNNLNY